MEGAQFDSHTPSQKLYHDGGRYHGTFRDSLREGYGKYFFTKKGGTWTARGLGDAAWEYAHCNQAGVLCEVRPSAADAVNGIYGGAIGRNTQSGTFYATGIRQDPSASHVFTVAGSCTKYQPTF